MLNTYLCLTFHRLKGVMLYDGTAGYVQWVNTPNSPDNTQILMNSGLDQDGLSWNWAPSPDNYGKPLCEKDLGK